VVAYVEHTIFKAIFMTSKKAQWLFAFIILCSCGTPKKTGNQIEGDCLLNLIQPIARHESSHGKTKESCVTWCSERANASCGESSGSNSFTFSCQFQGESIGQGNGFCERSQF
jgi:hypothetical protein